MSRANSGPIDALEQFLVHISLHSSDVFGSENADAMSSCVIDCFDAIADASESYSELISPWYGEETFDDANLPFERALQVVSVNLLVAENCGSKDVNVMILEIISTMESNLIL